MAGTTRYLMRIDPVWLPALALFGGTPGRSFVEVGAETVRFRFGWLFDETLPRSTVVGARRGRWPLIGGIGWRIGTRGTVGLIGSLRGVVHVQLREPRRVRLAFIPWRARTIAASLRDPEGFLREFPAAETVSRG